jgi:hypothetical protein
MQCKRCRKQHPDKDNYCSYCGAPLKLEILKQVRLAYELRRKKSVHNILTLLVKEGCIVPDKLNSLMARLEKAFGLKREAISE